MATPNSQASQPGSMRALGSFVVLVLFLGANPILGWLLFGWMGVHLTIGFFYAAWAIVLLCGFNLWLSWQMFFKEPEPELTPEQLKDRVGWHQ